VVNQSRIDLHEIGARIPHALCRGDVVNAAATDYQNLGPRSLAD
jgi:hypothetical protein